MFIIYLCYLFLLILLLLTINKDKNLNLVLTIISVITLLLVLGIRDIGIGKDDLQYVKIFDDIPPLDLLLDEKLGLNAESIEIGFVFLISFIKFFFLDYNAIFFIVGSVSLFTLGYVYYRASPIFFISILIFFSHFYLYRDLNQIRAALSCAILLNLLFFINKGRIYDVLIVAFSSLFHIASLVMLLYVFAKKYYLSNSRVIGILALSIIVGCSGIVEWFLSIIPGGGSYITTKLTNYANSEIHGASIPLFDLTNIKNIFILGLTLIYRTELTKIKYFEGVFLLMVINVCWRITFLDVSILAARGATFFAIIEPILVAMLVSVQKKYKILAYVLVIFYSLLMLYLNINVKYIITNYSQIVF